MRLSDAGLGCPDWPGCYGAVIVPDQPHEIAQANQNFPLRQLEPHKAWKEMIHRYVAGFLGMAVFLVALISWISRNNSGAKPGLAVFLVALVVFQALLGMWTVTLLLKPLIVLAHLAGGLALLSLIWWYLLCQHTPLRTIQPVPRWARWGAPLSLLIVMAQILLGGWTSTNYAALACTGFPLCSGEYWPSMDFVSGFTPWRGLGINYEFGVLEHPGRVAIHMTHRLGALLTFLWLGTFGIMLIRARLGTRVTKAAVVMLVILGVQIVLGIVNVTFFLPLPVAVAHNGTAAGLLITVITLYFYLRDARVKANG